MGSTWSNIDGHRELTGENQSPVRYIIGWYPNKQLLNFSELQFSSHCLPAQVLLLQAWLNLETTQLRKLPSNSLIWDFDFKLENQYIH